MLEYLDEMLAILEGPTFSICERNGVDQGIHNVIIYDRNLPNLELLNLDSGFILNLQGWSKRDSVRNFENVPLSITIFRFTYNYKYKFCFSLIYKF